MERGVRLQRSTEAAHRATHSKQHASAARHCCSAPCSSFICIGAMACRSKPSAMTWRGHRRRNMCNSCPTPKIQLGYDPILMQRRSQKPRAAAAVPDGLGAPACARRRRGRRRSAAAARAARPAAACASTRAPRPRVLPGRATHVRGGCAGLQGSRTGSCRPCSAWVMLKLALFTDPSACSVCIGPYINPNPFSTRKFFSP
jgi:hypothetical protein